MKDSRNKGRILIIVTALLWALAGVCVKSITWGTMDIVCARSLISLIILFIAKGSFKLKFTKTNILCGIMIMLTGILYVGAIKLTTAGTAIILQYIAPILVFLYEVIFKGRKARASEAVITLCVFAGCVLSFADSIDMTHVLGNFLALLSGFTFAAEIIIMNGEGSDSVDSTIFGNGFSFIVCLPFFIHDIPGLPFDATNITWVLILSVFQFGLANLLFAKGCKLIDSVECSLLLTIEPIFNPIPVAIICGERMGNLSLLGAAVVIMSITMYTLNPRIEERRTARKAKKNAG